MPLSPAQQRDGLIDPTRPRGGEVAHQTLPREKDAREVGSSPFADVELGTTSPIWSPSLWQVLNRAEALPNADWVFDPTDESVIVVSSSGSFIVDTVTLPLTSENDEPVKVLALRKLTADDAPAEDELPFVGPEVARRILKARVTDWERGTEPIIAIHDMPTPDATVLDGEDPLAQKLKAAARDAQEGTVDRAVDEDEDLQGTFDAVWGRFVSDIPQPVTAAGSPAPRLSPFARCDVAALTAIRRELDALSASTMSARTSQRALAIKNKIAPVLVASGLGEPEVRWIESAFDAGTRSVHTRGGSGLVGEITGGAVVAVDSALALAAASLRSREQTRRILGMRAPRVPA